MRILASEEDLVEDDLEMEELDETLELWAERAASETPQAT